DMGGEFGENHGPQAELGIEIVGGDALDQVDVHFDTGVLILVEIGPAEALVEVPVIDRFKARPVVEESGIEVEVFAIGIVGAIAEVDMVAVAFVLAAAHWIAIGLGGEAGCAIATGEIEDFGGIGAGQQGLGLS